MITTRTWTGYDQNCGKQFGHPTGYTDIDESCNMGGIIWGSMDDDCGKQIGPNLIDGDESR